MGRLSSPRRHQSNDRNNPLAVLKAVTALISYAASQRSYQAGISHTHLWTARTRQCRRYEYIQPLSLPSLHLISFRRFLFSTFLPHSNNPLVASSPASLRKAFHFQKATVTKKIYLHSLLFPSKLLLLFPPQTLCNVPKTFLNPVSNAVLFQ